MDTNWDHAYEGVKTNGRSGQPKPIDPTRILMLACPSVLEFPEEGIWRNRSKAEIEEEAGMVDSEVEEEPEVTTTKEGEAAPF